MPRKCYFNQLFMLCKLSVTLIFDWCDKGFNYRRKDTWAMLETLFRQLWVQFQMNEFWALLCIDIRYDLQTDANWLGYCSKKGAWSWTVAVHVLVSHCKAGNVHSLTDWLIDWLTDWLSYWLADWLAGWLSFWLADWLTLTELLTDTDWATDWLADWH